MRDGSAEFLLLHRSGKSGRAFWQGVSGWIEANETPHAAALRELAEETGLSAEALYTIDTVFYLYVWKRGTVEAIVPFATRVAGDDPAMSEEHDAFRWVTLDEAQTLLPYAAQREAVRHVAEDLAVNPDRSALYEVPLPER